MATLADMDAQTVAVQYPSFGPYHNARLGAIAAAAPPADWRVVGMEMFREDSDYSWEPVAQVGLPNSARPRAICCHRRLLRT